MKMNQNNKSFFLSGYTGFCLTALLLTFLLTSARLAKTNFSGDWALSKEKSTMAPGQMRIVYNKMKVTQDANNIIITRTGESPDGQEFSTEEKITLDGKESEDTFFNGMLKKKSTATWSADEKVMTIVSAITFSRDGNEMKINATEVWDNAKGPGALTVKYSSSSPNGAVNDTYVYDKK